MSIFILTVGLLGMASLIPVGSYQVGEAVKSDRAAAVGRAAFNEVRMRGLLDYRMWYGVDDLDTVAKIVAKPFVIDPLGDRQNPDGGMRFLFENRIPEAAVIQLRRWRDADQEMPEALEKHVFTSHDDLRFLPRKNADDPPAQLFLPNDTTQKRDSDDQYSWLVTVVPVGSEAGENSKPNEMHRVSVAVVYARAPNEPDDPKKPDEKTVPVVNATVDGGSRPSLPFDALVLSSATPAQLKLVKEGRWLFISGQAQGGRAFHRWYRVVSRRGSFVTVAGPEIVVAGRLSVVLLKNVVGVYEHSMKLDEPSLWTN